MNDKHIIAMGGGGFSMEESPLLDDYILSVSGKEKPKICFVGTASGDSERYQVKFYNRFASVNCRASLLNLFERGVSDLKDFACSQDVIYVGGGNTVNMLAIWREHGFDGALKEAHASGTVLAGVSAGSICWFESGVTDSFGTDLVAMDCLGFLKGSNCPHYDGEAKRRPSYHRMMQQGMSGGYAADDSVALHFVNGELFRAISSVERAKAYKVEIINGEIVEKDIQTEFLGKRSSQPGEVVNSE